jgi:hypothetical protein
LNPFSGFKAAKIGRAEVRKSGQERKDSYFIPLFCSSSLPNFHPFKAPCIWTFLNSRLKDPPKQFCFEIAYTYESTQNENRENRGFV